MKKSKRPFPLRFLIKGALWRVKIKKNLKDEKGKPCTGMVDTTDRILNISETVAPEHLSWVFYHEYGHALLYESGVTENSGGIEELTEEIICDAFADAMTRDKKVKWKRMKKAKL